MNSAEILKELERLTPKVPRAALQAAIRQKEKVIPGLLAALDRVNANADAISKDPEYVLHIHVVHLLAQFREPSALKPFLRLFSRLSDLAEYEPEYFTDVSGSRILASVSHGNAESLLETVAGENNNQIVRRSALEAISLLAIWRQTPKAKVIGCYRELFRSRLARPGDPRIWTGVVSAADDLKARELLPEIRSAYQAGLVDTDELSLEYVEKSLTRHGDALRRHFAEKNPPITSAIDEFKAWLRYREEEENEREEELRLSASLTSLNPQAKPENN